MRYDYIAYTTHESDAENWSHRSAAEVWDFENTHTLYIVDDHLTVVRATEYKDSEESYTYLMTI